MKRRWFVSLGGLSLLTVSSWAGPPPAVYPHPPAHGMPAPCPAPRLPAPSDTPTPAPGTTPQPTPPAAPAPSDTPADPTAGAPERGAESYTSYTPNLFGDSFGGPVAAASIRVPQTVPITALVTQANPRLPAVFQISQSAAGRAVFLTPPSGAFAHGFPITESYIQSDQPVQFINGSRRFALEQNAQDRNATFLFATTARNAAGNLVFNGTPIALAYNSDINSSFAQEVVGGANIQTSYNYSFLPFERSQVQVGSPSNPGYIGITKIADDNNPLPRDRVIFNYDFFSSVPLNQRGVPVHRFSPGLEKTFFDQNVSVEVRVPFSSTLTTDLLADGSTTNTTTEFGNVHVTLKALLYGNDALNIAAGVGVALPTADPIRVYSGPGGFEVLRVENDQIVLTPYVAYLWTPNRYVFFQNWIACLFNTIGNRVRADDDLTGLKDAGRMLDQHQLQIDAQLGFWLIYPGEGDGYLRGLAPFVELHWNSNISTAPTVVTSQFILTPPNPRFNELNLSAGALFQLGDAVNLMVGAAVPLLNESNRLFDYQIGVRCSIFFGETLRDRRAATRVSAF